MDQDTSNTVLISACLLGQSVRYDGASKANEFVVSLSNKIKNKPICPEMAGGLPCPRPASEIKGSRVINSMGTDVTEYFIAGAKDACTKAQDLNSSLAILKAKSPSCSSSKVYDGTFSAHLIHGLGVSAQALQKQGVLVVDENKIEELKITKEHPLALFISEEHEDSRIEISGSEGLVLPLSYSDEADLTEALNLAGILGARIGLISDRSQSSISPLLKSLLAAYQDTSQELAQVLADAQRNDLAEQMQLIELSHASSTGPTINVILKVLISLFK